MHIKKPDSFSFQNAVTSHGWYQLMPFELNDGVLSICAMIDGKPSDVEVWDKSKTLGFRCVESNKQQARNLIRHLLRIDEPFEDFYQELGEHSDYRWIAEKTLGPLLRSPTVFEDVVKTICTTNCSWALTKSMIRNLVTHLGELSPSGKRTFPTPEAMAACDERFFSDSIRAGYRGPYLLEFARSVADGRVEPEDWLVTDIETPELKKSIKAIKGVGDYAAENMLKLVGRYDGLALDSFLRSGFYKKHNKGKECPDKKIHKHYSPFGKWMGLVIWFDMVRKEIS